LRRDYKVSKSWKEKKGAGAKRGGRKKDAASFKQGRKERAFKKRERGPRRTNEKLNCGQVAQEQLHGRVNRG